MKNIRPIVLLSFIFFASVIANDFSEPAVDNEFSDSEDNDNLDLSGEDFGFDSGENEDIIFSGGIVSTKPPSNFPTSSSLIKSPIKPPVCKKWRCRMNGYTPIWISSVSRYCRDNYAKMSIFSKANCQDQYCEKTCVSF